MSKADIEKDVFLEFSDAVKNRVAPTNLKGITTATEWLAFVSYGKPSSSPQEMFNIEKYMNSILRY